MRLIPRDDSVRIRLQTSTDTAQTGVRQVRPGPVLDTESS